MKKVSILILVLLLCFTITACGNDTENPNDNDQTVKIGLLSIDDSLPFFVAEQEGLYDDLGVDVELIPFGSALDKETALEAGEIDGDMTDLVVAGLLKKGGNDIKVVETALGAEPIEGRFVLLASPNSGITDVNQLKGETIAIGNNTIIQYICDQICYINGFTDDEIVTENIPDLVLRMETLLSDGITAAILPDPLATVAINAGAIPLVDDTKISVDGQPVNLSQSVVIFTQDSIDAKGESIDLAMEAYRQAKVLINENPDAYRDALKTFTSIPENLAATYAMPTYTPKVLPTAGEINSVFEWMFAKGLTDELYDYNSIVDETFVN